MPATASQKIHIHPLACGLTLVAEEMDWLESAAFAMLLPAGCVYEKASEAGLASLTCEMLQRGAGDRDSRQFVSDLENLGADCSASVSVSHMSFGGSMPKESLPTVLSMYADLVRRPLLPEDQLEDARLSCLQEVRAVEDDLSQRVMQELRRRYYGEPWGRSSQGKVETLESMQQKNVQSFFSERIRPNRGILSVAGKIDWPQLRDQIEDLFGDWRPGLDQQIVETTAERGYHHIQHDSNQTLVGLAMDGLSYANEDYFQLRGAIGALSDGMSSRLFTEVREKRGYVYSVYANCHSLRDRGSVIAFAGTTPEHGQDTFDVTWGELKRMYAGIEQDELDRLKGRIKRSLIIQQESSPARAGSIALDWYYLQHVRTKDELQVLIDGLSCESINGWLAAHPPRNLTVVSLGPQPIVASSSGKV
jgi:predicted Zn-dependent peptidase